MSETENTLVELLQPRINELGYDLYDLSFKGGSLQIVIDRKEPISLDEVVSVSEAVSAILDEADPIEGAYTLDLSSAGAEKRIALDKLEDYVGSYLAIHLSHPYKGENDLQGSLISLTPETIDLEIAVKARKQVIRLNRADVEKARLAIKF